MKKEEKGTSHQSTKNSNANKHESEQWYFSSLFNNKNNSNIMTPRNFYQSMHSTVPFISPSQRLPQIPIVPTLAGTLGFAATLSLSTLLQAKLLHVSTGTPRPIPSLLGLGSVAIASLVCHYVSMQAFQLSDNADWLDPTLLNWKNDHDSLFFVNNSPPVRLQQCQSTMGDVYSSFQTEGISFQDFDVAHTLRVVLIGLIAFKGLGGRFWSVSPSSFTHLGSFARTINSIPATESYATLQQRTAIGKLGKVLGCHTCGDRMYMKTGLKSGTKFIADHMPPKAVVKQMNGRWYRRLFDINVKQRFYPQCVNCSQRQANILSDASRKVMVAKKSYMRRIPNLALSGGGRNAHIHGMKLRREHFAGTLLATATVSNSDELDVASGNKLRFRDWQMKVEDVFQFCWDSTQRRR